MLGYTIKRLLQMVLVLFCVSVIVFLMMSFTGDPVFMVIPIDSTTAEIEQARRLLGLDRSLVSQYFIFL
ncbi:MAG TPA: ABC transporter permease, partial [Rhizobium sp.]|nr:ABC transporter permease [Rhizobium sp.]